MVVGLFTSVYFNNIGNGFLDLGAEFELQSVLNKEEKLVKMSQYGNFVASLGSLFTIKEIPIVKWTWENLMQNKFSKKIHNASYNVVKNREVLSPTELFQVDYLVIPGCVLTIHFFKIYFEMLMKKSREGCKIIFLGASGNYYTSDEITFVSNCLKKLNPYAIMTRDSVAYKYYQKYALYSYNGIDNAFFVNRLSIPEMNSSKKPYCVINIENKENAEIKRELEEKIKLSGKNIIYTGHCPYPISSVSKALKRDRFMISDFPLDYLVLYKNAEAVYSDRVHACITTLSFGNEVTLYSNSPRKALFKNVDVQPISGEPIRIQNLEEKQQNQIDFLKSILK